MKENLKGCLSIIFSLFVLGTVVGALKLISGKSGELHLENPIIRVIGCAGFVFWGFIYWGVKENAGAKIAFGIIQIVASVLSNWYQLGKLAEVGVQQHVYDRLVFIAVGIAGLTTGWKNLSEGVKSNGSSAVQAPGPQAPK